MAYLVLEHPKFSASNFLPKSLIGSESGLALPVFSEYDGSNTKKYNVSKDTWREREAQNQTSSIDNKVP